MHAGQRIKAARALAGFDATEDLAEHVDLGATTLRKMERGERPARPRELRDIAEACGLPYEFFTVNFADLTEVDRVGERIADVEDTQRVILEYLVGRDEAEEEARLHELEVELASVRDRSRRPRPSRRLRGA